MGVFDPWDWLIVILVALVVFGPKRIPEVAKALGKGIREFKDAFKDSSGEAPRANPAPAPASLPEKI